MTLICSPSGERMEIQSAYRRNREKLRSYIYRHPSFAFDYYSSSNKFENTFIYQVRMYLHLPCIILPVCRGTTSVNARRQHLRAWLCMRKQSDEKNY